MSLPFSVLMSVYSEDEPAYLSAALQSLVSQTLPADEIVLVQDGPITPQLASVIEAYARRLTLCIIALPENFGLAHALNEGLRQCAHDWVARMDSDDIALPERFEKQIGYILKHPDVDVLGALVEERDEAMSSILSIRRVPLTHQEIRKFAVRRNPISHPVAIFRKSAVLSVGGYPLFPKAQDYALWSIMLMRGFKFANQGQCLLWMRCGRGLMGRRGFNYFVNEAKLLAFQRRIGLLGPVDYWMNMFGRAAVRVAPSNVKTILYRCFR